MSEKIIDPKSNRIFNKVDTSLPENLNKFNKHDMIKHIKSGEIYQIINPPFRLGHSNESFYKYVDMRVNEPIFWFKSRTEMEDGSFELIK